MAKISNGAVTWIIIVAGGIVCGLMLALIIRQPTRDLRADLGRWIKPEALTDEGRAALLK